MKINKIVCLVLTLILTTTISVTAFAAPYQNYTVTESGVYPEPQAYVPDQVINSGLIGLENLGGVAISSPQDLTLYKKNGYVILSDTGNKRVIVLDSDLRTVKQIISTWTKDGVEDTFKYPNGLFVHEAQNLLFVCDTDNQRIVSFSFSEETGLFSFVRTYDDPDISKYFTEDGEENVTATVTPAPTEEPTQDDSTDATEGEGTADGEIPDDEIEIDNNTSTEGSTGTQVSYKPLKVVVDNAMRMFVVSKDCYQGLVELNDNGEFTKFYGATKTKQSLSALLNRLFTADAKSKRQQNLSTEYSNVTMDDQGFIYGTISQLKLDELTEHFASSAEIGAALRKLNAAGSDVLKRTGITPPSGDKGDEKNRSSYSYLCDATVSKNGLTSVLDSQKGRVFTYTSNGELLYVFGALGQKLTQVGEDKTSSREEQVGYTMGTNLSPVAIQLLNDDETIVVLDAQGAQMTTYKPTEYGLILRDAINSHAERRYDDALEAWNKILGMSSNSSLAYRGVGKIYYLNASVLKVDENADIENIESIRIEQREEKKKVFLQAADCFMKGYSQDEYGRAFYQYRDLVLEDVMPYLMWGIILVVAATTIFGWVKKFKKFVRTGGRDI